MVFMGYFFLSVAEHNSGQQLGLGRKLSNVCVCVCIFQVQP